MRFVRSPLAAGTVFVALLLASCSSSSSTATTTTPPASSAPTTTVPTNTSPATVSVPVTVESTSPSTTTMPPASSAPTSTVPSGPKLYDKVSGPKVPATHTDAVVTSGAFKDGVYWAQLVGGDTTGPSVTVVQAFFGKECQTKAIEMGDECLNDIYILAAPSRDVANLPFAKGATITVADPNTMQSLWVTSDELVFLRTSGPTGGAPKNYAYAPFSYLMTVKGGTITGFEQVWTP